jgi:hypothetical protein
MKVKTYKVTGEVGPDGKLTPEAIKRAVTGLLQELGDKLNAEQREYVEREVAAKLGEKPLLVASSESMCASIKKAEDLLDDLYEGVLALAQSCARPAHIFDLGGAAEKLLLVQALLNSTRGDIEKFAECQSSHHEHDQPEKDETLS